jgi:hypothetical protein
LKSAVMLLMGEAMIASFLAPSQAVIAGRTEHELPGDAAELDALRHSP